ncbi:MAG: N-6 DNA methylase [Candidatus Micrarchaeota archaeon]
MLESKLKASINKLWDRFWSGGIANPLLAIEQISYLIFMRRLEDLDTKHIERAKALKENYQSLFINNENCRWSHWKHYNAEKMLLHVRDIVFPFIKNITRGEDTVFSQNMKDAMFLIPKPSLLQEAVSIIDELNISSQNQDTQGDIYEYLLNELSSSGKNGQFRTPRHIIRMMVQLLDPQVGQTICDPACGTGGFLISAYEHILLKNTSNDLIQYDEQGHPHNLIGDKITNPKQWDFLRRETFFGHDFDSTMIRIALMNMILHGIEHPKINYADALSKNFSFDKKYDIILANPPFTGSIDKGDINDLFKVQTPKTELLFVELFYHLLRTGGRAAVIVPQGVLFGSSNAHKDIRKRLLEECQFEAVISMPSGVFQPYSGVATAVLVFTKGDRTNKVWFYEMKADGFSLDQKRTFINGKGDLPNIVELFKTKSDSSQSFSVNFEDIKKNDYNLNLSQYKVNNIEKIEYEEPEVLISKIAELEKEIEKDLEELKGMVE